MDRNLVLLRAARPVAPPGEGPGRPGRRRRRRALGGARRRLLPRAEVRGRPAAAPRPPRLVQVGGVHDLALGVRVDDRPLLPRGVQHAREARQRPRPLGRGRDLDRPPRDRVDRVRRAEPSRHGSPRPLGRALRAGRARGVGLRGAVQPPGGVAPGRRDDRHGDGGERLRGDHPRALGAHPREGSRPRAGSHARAPGEAALGTQQLPHAAGPADDAGGPLPVRVRRRQRVARARRADGDRRLGASLLQPPPRGPNALVDAGRRARGVRRRSRCSSTERTTRPPRRRPPQTSRSGSGCSSPRAARAATRSPTPERADTSGRASMPRSPLPRSSPNGCERGRA